MYVYDVTCGRFTRTRKSTASATTICGSFQLFTSMNQWNFHYIYCTRYHAYIFPDVLQMVLPFVFDNVFLRSNNRFIFTRCDLDPKEKKQLLITVCYQHMINDFKCLLYLMR